MASPRSLLFLAVLLLAATSASEASFTDWVSGLASQAKEQAEKWGEGAQEWVGTLGSDGQAWLQEKLKEYTGGMIENVKDAAACATAGGKWEEMGTDVSAGAEKVVACFRTEGGDSSAATTTTLPILMAASISLVLARIA